MKSLRFTEYGPPSVLRIQEVGIPEPGEGEALVQVKAAGINPSDIGNVVLSKNWNWLKARAKRLESTATHA